ncbi:MAG TPA: VacB/RNase II family 3'-5' exoribonuclease [Thermoleophilaceae bacterium]|nr:VacB/RNase II family 3'-5' exoribonuclease [Thermoleophilaceae bacterium]
MSPPAGEPLVAVLEKRGRFTVAEPLFDPGRRITLEGSPRRAGGVGEMVLLGWGKRGARAVRSLGRPDVARDVLEALMLDRGLRRTFPRAVESEAVEAAEVPPGEDDRPERRDLTGLATFTIDPETARDYDDAISARREEGRAVRVWVHIADVSAYVRPGTALERETQRRATSVYVPGAVEPMLPEALSSGACSLVPGQERLAVTLELLMDGPETRSVAFHRSRIRSDARLTYEQVDRIFAGEEEAAAPWSEPLAAAREVAAALRDRRDRRGALAVESPEPSFEFDEGGNVTGVRYEDQTESHRLIEELMILANERVADRLADRQAPTLYRVHERPEPQAVERLIDQLASLDVPTPPVPRQMSPQQAGDVAAEASQLVAAHVRRTGRGRWALGSLVLRSLKQAYYSPRNLGHAGLASPRYCHFTSPIRRYPDLVAHRALLASLGLDDAGPRADVLFELGEHCSSAERDAMKIERSADDVCLCFLLERRLGERGPEAEFDGEVVGVISKGAFVRFGDEGFEGFLPVRRMRGDWYHLNEAETALVGEGGGRAFRLGDPLRVTVGRVEAARGRADLELAPDHG